MYDGNLIPQDILIELRDNPRKIDWSAMMNDADWERDWKAFWSNADKAPSDKQQKESK